MKSDNQLKIENTAKKHLNIVCGPVEHDAGCWHMEAENSLDDVRGSLRKLEGVCCGPMANGRISIDY